MDTFTPTQRSAVMRAVKSRDTAPEMRVRRAAHKLGLRFRLQRGDLPGKPDLVFPSRRAALFVHGCFWHGHACARGDRTPATNTGYWQAKIARNVARDSAVILALNSAGWRTVIVWECETRNGAVLAEILATRVQSTELRQIC